MRLGNISQNTIQEFFLGKEPIAANNVYFHQNSGDAQTLRKLYIVSFLKSVQVNQKVRLLTKFKNLSEEWTGCIAVREQHSWSLKYDGRSDCEIDANFDDEDEENSVLSVNNWLLGWCSFDNRSASKNSGADEVPIKWGDFELGGDQLDVDCIHSSGSFRLYSKMLRSGKVFLVTKNLVNIRSEPHLFYIAVPKIGENVDSDPNDYLAVVYNIPGKSVQVAELGMVRPNDSPTESDIDITSVLGQARNAVLYFLRNSVLNNFTVKSTLEDNAKSSSKNDFSRQDLAHEQVHLQQQFQETKKSPKKRRARTQPDRYRQSPLPNSPLSFRAQRMHIPKVGEKKLKTNIGPKRNSSMLATKNPTKKSSPTADVFCGCQRIASKD